MSDTPPNQIPNIRMYGDTVIVIGCTGSGKSSLINALMGTGNQEAEVGGLAGACTPDLKSYCLRINDRNFNLVDTAGFGDPSGPENDWNFKKKLLKAIVSARMI